MRIAVVTNHLTDRGGGISAAIRPLYTAISQLTDAEICLFGVADAEAQTPTGSQRRKFGVKNGGPDEIRYSAIGPATLAIAPQLPRLLRAGRFDIVHSHGLWSFTSIATLAWYREAGRPYVVSPHGMLDEWAVRHSKWKKRLAGPVERMHLRRAAIVHALNAIEAGAITRYCPGALVRTVSNGVEMPDCRSVREKKPTWAESIPGDLRVLLYLGRLHPKKGLRELLNAFKSALTNCPAAWGWMLAIAGWDQGGHESELKALTLKLGLNGRVIFTGPQFGSAKDETYRFVDAFALASHSEGLPMTVLEAWSYGLPVLMTDACNLSEGFVEGAAIKIDHRDGKLADGLCRLFELDKPSRRAIGEKGRQLVKREFSWEKAASEMHTIYSELLA